MKPRVEQLFWIGLALRLASLPFFGSYQSEQLFLPFINYAVQHPGHNPWAAFPAQFFPYGSFLFLLLYIPKQLAYWLLGDIVLSNSMLGLALLKAPLLLLDWLLLGWLSRLEGKRELLLRYFWLNPICFYITYVLGQLDLVVTALAFLSMTLLLQQRLLASALALACALSSKFQVAIIVPLLVTYIWNAEFVPKSVYKIATWVGTFTAVALVAFLPVMLAGDLGHTSVASPEAMRVFAARLDFGDGTVFYLGTAALLVVLGRLCAATMLSGRALVLSGGLLFGVLLLVTRAAPGWYFWVMPFLAMLYASHQNTPRSPWYLLHAAYFCNFVLLPLLPAMPEATSNLARGLSFTILQTALLALLIAMWVLAIRSESRVRRFVKPLMVGIAGDSGAGKNRLASALADVFEVARTVVLEGDDYHKWERGDDRYTRYTHLSPKANNLRALHAHAEDLSFGRSVYQRHYDHGSGRFTEKREVRYGRTIIVQGLHTFYLRAMRDKFDLKIFLKPHENVRRAWKIQRDVHERGHALHKVITTMESRQADSDQHIAPQRLVADWIIEATPAQSSSPSFEQQQPMPITMRHVLWNDAEVAALVHELNQTDSCRAELQIDASDLDRLVVWVSGEPSVIEVECIGAVLFPNLRYITRGRRGPVWRGGHDGVAQLLALTLLDAKRDAGSGDEVDRVAAPSIERTGSVRDGSVSRGA